MMYKEGSCGKPKGKSDTISYRVDLVIYVSRRGEKCKIVTQNKKQRTLRGDYRI